MWSMLSGLFSGLGGSAASGLGGAMGGSGGGGMLSGLMGGGGSGGGNPMAATQPGYMDGIMDDTMAMGDSDPASGGEGVDMDRLMQAMMAGGGEGAGAMPMGGGAKDMSQFAQMTPLEGLMGTVRSNKHQPPQSMVGMGAPRANEYLRSLMGG